jgi:predicted ribosomally synthesized peptide with nif11-like leader
MDKVREFYEALLKDEAMQERGKGLKVTGETTVETATEAIIAFAKSEGYTFTAGELKDASKELSDQELAAVAGGDRAGGNCYFIGFQFGSGVNGHIDTCLCFFIGMAGLDGIGNNGGGDGSGFFCFGKGTD